MAAAATATVVTISYDKDLAKFDKSNPDPILLEKIGNAYGQNGLGILAVTDLPSRYSELREQLLPKARLISKLPPPILNDCVKPQTLYSVGWSHGKEFYEPGKPDYAKGSFYANPLTDDLVQSLVARDIEAAHDAASETKQKYYEEQAVRYPEFYAPNVYPSEEYLPKLHEVFTEMGQLMASVGRQVAAVCDAYCRREKNIELNLEKTLTRSLNAKGRLLHYFAVEDDDGAEPSTSNEEKKTASEAAQSAPSEEKESSPNMWCGWHNDHGSLTALVPAMYLDSEGRQVVDVECDVEENDGGSSSGLHIQSRTGEIVRVKLPTTALGFQIGETSQIQSGGVLQATPHAVRSCSSTLKRGAGGSGVTRESFALFLEPEFDDLLQIPPGKTIDDCQDPAATPLPSSVIPLKNRWKPGQNFGDFHRATVSAFTPDDEANPEKNSLRRE